MAGVYLEIHLDGGIARYGHRLAAMADQLPQIEREGLQEGGGLVTTRIRRALRHQMNTKAAGPITAHTSGVLASNTTYIIRGMGKGLPITDFPVKGGRKKHGNWRDQPRDGIGRFGPLPNRDAGSVVAQSWGVAHRFKRSFALASGGFVATLPGSRRMRRLYGPSVAKEIGQGESAATFNGQAGALVEQCIFRRLGRLM